MTDEEMYDLGVKAAKKISLSRTAHLTSFAIGFDDGSIKAPRFTACHGYFSRIIPTKPKTLVIANQINMTKKEFKGVKGWYDYLLNDSPFQDAYLSKDVNKIYDESIIVRLDRNNNYAIAAAIATRHGWEFPGMMATWDALVESGMNKRKAFFLSFILVYRNENRFTYGPRGGHSSFYPVSTNKEGLVRFLNNDFADLSRKAPLYMNCHTYRGVPSMWGSQYGSQNELLKKISQFCKTASDPGVNPFPCINLGLPLKEGDNQLEKMDELLEEYMT